MASIASSWLSSCHALLGQHCMRDEVLGVTELLRHLEAATRLDLLHQLLNLLNGHTLLEMLLLALLPAALILFQSTEAISLQQRPNWWLIRR